MKTMNKLGLYLWTGLTLLAGQGASATSHTGSVPHFTLRVPLEMSKLHERITHIQVRCSTTAPQGQYAPRGPHQEYRNGRMTVDRQTGLPTQSHIALEFNAPAGVDPRAFTTYNCRMDLIVDGSSNVDPRTDTTRDPVTGVDTSQPYRNSMSGELKP